MRISQNSRRNDSHSLYCKRVFKCHASSMLILRYPNFKQMEDAEIVFSFVLTVHSSASP